MNERAVRTIKSVACLFCFALAAMAFVGSGEILSGAAQAVAGQTQTTPHMETLVERATAAGALGAKVCGAGGGGCIAFLCEEGARAAVEQALVAEEGAEVLRWTFARDGLVVRES